MSDVISTDQSESAVILVDEISDDALEAIGSATEAALYTLGGCTGLSSCPA